MKDVKVYYLNELAERPTGVNFVSSSNLALKRSLEKSLAFSGEN
jgi:hypothetical protein